MTSNIIKSKFLLNKFTLFISNIFLLPILAIVFFDGAITHFFISFYVISVYNVIKYLYEAKYQNKIRISAKQPLTSIKPNFITIILVNVIFLVVFYTKDIYIIFLFMMFLFLVFYVFNLYHNNILFAIFFIKLYKVYTDGGTIFLLSHVDLQGELSSEDYLYLEYVEFYDNCYIVSKYEGERELFSEDYVFI